jgi:hypothetical protein
VLEEKMSVHYAQEEAVVAGESLMNVAMST